MRPSRRARGVRRRELRPLAIAADEHGAGAAGAGSAMAGSAAASRPSLTAWYSSVVSGSGRTPELAVEQADALAVLPQRLGAVPDRREQLDQTPVRRLVERVEREPPARVRDRRRRSGRPPASARGQAREHASRARAAARRRPHCCQLSKATLSRRPKPASRSSRCSATAVVSAAISPCVAHGHRGELAEAGARRSRRRPRRATRPSARCASQPPPRPVLSVESVRRSAARARSSSESRPEQRRQAIARVRVPGDGEVGEQRDRLARVDPQRLAVDLDARSAEKCDRQRHTSELLTRPQRQMAP